MKGLLLGFLIISDIEMHVIKIMKKKSNTIINLLTTKNSLVKLNGRNLNSPRGGEKQPFVGKTVQWKRFCVHYLCLINVGFGDTRLILIRMNLMLHPVRIGGGFRIEVRWKEQH